MTEKKPQAGEWWEYNGVRIHIVGITTKGLLSCEYKDGTMSVLRQGDHWKHLTDCKSFEWQPETFPQWYVCGNSIGWGFTAYVVRDTATTYFCVEECGRESRNSAYQWEQGIVTSGHWKQVTQAEAESRIKKPESVESPDDWVTQDVVPFRPNLDQRRWVTVTGGVACDWEFVDEITTAQPVVHGALNKCSNRLEIRCRRKHLPKETPKPNYVRLWTHRTSGTVCTATDEKYLKYPDIWTELKHDGTGFYLAAD